MKHSSPASAITLELTPESSSLAAQDGVTDTLTESLTNKLTDKLTESTASLNSTETPIQTDTHAVQSGAANTAKPQERNAAWQIFFSTFVTIFLAELGDKTQVTTLLMTAESHQPWVVFAGAGSALVATSLIGVWLGCWLAKRVSARTLETAAGALLLLIALQLVWEIVHP